MCNIFDKIITENFPNLEKDIPMQMQEASRTPNRSSLLLGLTILLRDETLDLEM
jgi:hypothetical protein